MTKTEANKLAKQMMRAGMCVAMSREASFHTIGKWLYFVWQVHNDVAFCESKGR